jgi:hypothetical protein
MGKSPIESKAGRYDQIDMDMKVTFDRKYGGGNPSPQRFRITKTGARKNEPKSHRFERVKDNRKEREVNESADKEKKKKEQRDARIESLKQKQEFATATRNSKTPSAAAEDKSDADSDSEEEKDEDENNGQKKGVCCS